MDDRERELREKYAERALKAQAARDQDPFLIEIREVMEGILVTLVADIHRQYPDGEATGNAYNDLIYEGTRLRKKEPLSPGFDSSALEAAVELLLQRFGERHMTRDLALGEIISRCSQKLLWGLASE